MNITIKNKKIINDDIDNDVKLVFEKFMQSNYANKQSTTTQTFIKEYFRNRTPVNINDFNDDSFYIDCRITDDNYKNIKGRKLTPHEKRNLKNFYSFLIENNYGNFNEITVDALNYNGLYRSINNGFKIYLYNLFEEFPENDKWLLLYNHKIYKFDFSKINFSTKREYLKKYIWEETSPKINIKHQRMDVYVDFLNYIDDNLPLNLTVGDIMNFKNIVSADISSQAAFIKMSSIKSLVYFLENENLVKINKLTYNSFKMTNVRSQGQTDYYSDEETNIIIQEMREKVDNETDRKHKVLYQLHLIAVLYILNTAMRENTVLNLKISDLRGTVNNYYYISESKKKKDDIYNITNDIKKLHDEILHITESFRNGSQNHLNEFLFIYQRIRGQNISLLNSMDISRAINLICSANNIKKLGVTGVRNRFMNKLTKRLDGGIDKALLTAVSKHSLNVHYNNYYNSELEDICLQMYGVNIGNTNLQGMVKPTPKIEPDKRDVVLQGRGVCSVDKCKDKTVLDCLMCRYFVCTPINIPYFEQEIKKIDKQIKNMNIEHEKEFLIAKKRLNVKYLVECYKVKEGENNG